MSYATAKSSGLLAAGTTAVIARKTILSGVTLVGDGTNACSVVVYDNPSAASGTVLAKAQAGPNTGSPTSHITFPSRVRADTGITVVVTGTGAGAIIYYEA